MAFLEVIIIDKWLEVPTKFKLQDKVYHPRICSEKKTLIDIREYYIVRIDVILDKYSKTVNYHASPNKDNVRGLKFYDGSGLFHTYEEALEYARQEGCLI